MKVSTLLLLCFVFYSFFYFSSPLPIRGVKETWEMHVLNAVRDGLERQLSG